MESRFLQEPLTGIQCEVFCSPFMRQNTQNTSKDLRTDIQAKLCAYLNYIYYSHSALQ